MVRLIDHTGEIVGRLTVLSRASNSRQNQAQWLCQCACGNTCIVRGSQLRNGRCNSCGCLKVEVVVRRCTKHGHSPMYARKSPTYHSWASMVSRCTDPGNR